jgi:hypothetical protein
MLNGAYLLLSHRAAVRLEDPAAHHGAASKVAIVTSKVGTELPVGEFLAARGQKGIWRNVLGPGKYRLNPYGYRIELVDAIRIPIGYVGVVTRLSGEQARPGSSRDPGRRGCAGLGRGPRRKVPKGR